MKQRRLIAIVIALILALLSLTGYSLYFLVTSRNSIETRLQVQLNSDISSIKIPSGTNGTNAVVDYDKISAYIDSKINAIPAPKDGNPGAPGANGLSVKGDTGLNGSSCSAQQLDSGAAIVCTDGSSAVVQNGTNGADGKTPQLRCNDTKNRWEVRYSDDENWVILNNKVTPCELLL